MSWAELARLHDYARQRADDREEPPQYRPLWAQIANEVEAYQAPDLDQSPSGDALFGPDDEADRG